MTSHLDDDFDPYRELQLAPDAEPELVKAAFKALAKKYHPDRYSDPADKARAEARMARINEAQRLLQSGQYVPPRPVEPQSQTTETRPTEPPQPAPPKIQEKRAKPPSPKEPHDPKVSSRAFLVLAAFLLAVLVLPRFFTEDHLKKALELEKQGSYTQALEEMNKAVKGDPYNRELYTHRARIWDALGRTEQAAQDRKNAETPKLDLSRPSEPTASPTSR